MAHRTQILNGSKTITAICSCGWIGPDRQGNGPNNDLQKAREDAADHVIDSLRAKGAQVSRPGAPTGKQ